jgi:hypothetical protein
MIGEHKEVAAAKGTKKATGRVRKTAIFFLGALVAATLVSPALAAPGRDQQQPSEPQTTTQTSERQIAATQTSGQPTTTQPPQQQATNQQITAQPSAAKQAQQDTSHSQLSAKERESLQHETEKGTSKDRILWTLPNFLTVEDADNIPALTAGQKFKVVGRSLIDPSEFVLIGFVAGLGQASDSNPSYGQGAQGYGKRYATSYADNAVENFMASAVLPPCCIRIRAITNWAAADFGGERCTR